MNIPSAITCVIFATALFGCDVAGSFCSDDLVQQFPSPSGERIAVVLVRRCGVTTGSTAHLQLLKSGEEPSMGRISLMSIDDTVFWSSNTKEEQMKHREISRLDVRWANEDSLVITIDPRARLLHHKDSQRDVHLKLERRPLSVIR